MTNNRQDQQDGPNRPKSKTQEHSLELVNKSTTKPTLVQLVDRQAQGGRTATGSQEQTATATAQEGQAKGAGTIEERRASNRSLLQQFLQEVIEGAEAAPSPTDRISKSTAQNSRDCR